MKEKLINILIAAASFPYGMDSRSEIELLADYLIKNGVIVLPCKVGDTVYTNCAMTGWYFRKKDKPYSAKVVFIGLNDSEKMGGGLINVVYGKHDFMMQFSFSDIGKSVFLTREEAEAALKPGLSSANKEALLNSFMKKAE